jgi:hypothetical protein
MTNNAKIEIMNMQLGAVSSGTSAISTHSTTCKNNKATSAEVKCTLPSQYKHTDIIKDINVNFNQLNLNDISSDVNFNIGSNYRVVGNNLANLKDIGKFIQLDGKANWHLEDNSITGFSLDSNKIGSSNTLESIIPPSSCFELVMNEKLSEYHVPYTATAKMVLHASDGSMITGTELNTIASGISGSHQTSFRSTSIPISGEIVINVVGNADSGASPCDL